jgi:hypothetical protein
MVAGGIAVNLYGIERATADIDIILDLEGENLLKFVEVAKKLGLKPRVPVKLEDFIDPEKRLSWITDKGMKVFSLYDPENCFFVLDVFVEMPFNFNEAYKQRKKMKFEDTAIPIVSMKDLIEMKKKAGRPQDRADVFYLEKILKEWKDE